MILLIFKKKKSPLLYTFEKYKMVLQFSHPYKNYKRSSKDISIDNSIEAVTLKNINFLKSLGFKIRYGNTARHWSTLQ